MRKEKEARTANDTWKIISTMVVVALALGGLVYYSNDSLRKEMGKRIDDGLKEVRADIRALNSALIGHIDGHSHTPESDETANTPATPADTSDSGIAADAAPLPENAEKPELQG